MKPLLLSLAALLFLGSAQPYREPLPVYPPRPTILRYLPGLRMTESSGRNDVAGDQGRSRGEYQILEDYHAERAQRFGEYDPLEPSEAECLAGCILLDNRAAFVALGPRTDPDTWLERQEDLALASYRQGVQGVRDRGPTYWYVLRIQGATL